MPIHKRDGIITFDRPDISAYPPDYIGDEPMLTARQVGHMLGLGKTKVHEMAKSGELPSYRFGTARRFLRSEVREAVQRFREHGYTRAPRRMRRQQAEAYREPARLEQPGPRTR